MPLTDQPADERSDQIREASWAAKFALGAYAIHLHIVACVLYFLKHGYPSSPAADIWFFAGVAYRVHSVFKADPLQWLLPLLGWMRPETLFGALVFFSNLLHLLALFLLYRLLREWHRDERAALWACAIFTSASGSLVFCTGSFHHQQFSLPLLILLLHLGLRILREMPWEIPWRLLAAFGAALVVGLCIGPDVAALLALAPPAFALAWIRRRKMGRAPTFLAGSALLALYFGLLLLLTPWLDGLRVALMQKMRGIDFIAQRLLRAGDVLPMGWADLWSRQGLLSLGILAAAAWAWRRGRFLELAFLLTTVFLARFQGRFAFLLDIAAAVLASWILCSGLLKTIRLQSAAGAALLLLFLGTAIHRGVPCMYPASLVDALAPLREDPTPNRKVLCTPTYGFLVRALTRAEPTSDMHKLRDARGDYRGWMRIATQQAGLASVFLRRLEVTHVFFTSYDLREATLADPRTGRTVAGILSSGGLEEFIPQLSDEELSQSLAWQALYGRDPIRGTIALSSQTDTDTGLKSVLLKIEGAANKKPVVPFR